MARIASPAGFWSSTASSGPFDEQAPRDLVEFVADEHRRASPVECPQCSADPFVADGNVVDPAQVGIAPEGVASEAFGERRLLAAFHGLHDVAFGGNAAAARNESRFRVLHAEKIMHARHHEHLAPGIAEETAHQFARNPARPAIVDTHVSQPSGPGQVARERDDRHRAADLAQGRRDVRMLVRDDDQRVGLLRRAPDGFGHVRRFQAIEVGDGADRALRLEGLFEPARNPA